MKIVIEHHQHTSWPTNIMVFCYKYSDRLECFTHGIRFKDPTSKGHGFDYARVGTWNVKYKNR